MRKSSLVIIVGLLVAAAACSSTSDTGTVQTNTTVTATTPATDPTTETKKNKDPKPYREVIDLAIADIQDFWTETLPEVYGKDYETIPDSKLFPATSDKVGPACSPKGGNATYEDVQDNAFYCSLGGFVEWDDEGLMPRIYKQYGEYAVAMVFAHEWGHAIQDQMGFMTTTQSIVRENQADCFAGAWTAHALDNKSKTGFRATQADLQSALAGMLEFRDEPGSDAEGDQAHGSGFDRVNGFQVGFDQGAAKCATWPDDPPAFTEFAFSDKEELASGGNVAYKDAIKLATSDLNAYWKSITTQFQDVDSILTFSAAGELPKCGDQQYTEEDVQDVTAFFCVDDNYVAWDDDKLSEVNDEIGDFGVAVILAQQWTASFQHQNGQTEEQITSKQGNLQRACFTGSWARAVWDGDLHNVDSGTGQGSVKLSPGDLDEAVKAFLAFSETPDEEGETATGSAFEQIAAFRDGFLSTDGAVECAGYNADDAKGDDTGA
jgi:predicted metalloprotease